MVLVSVCCLFSEAHGFILLPFKHPLTWLEKAFVVLVSWQRRLFSVLVRYFIFINYDCFCRRPKRERTYS